MVKSFKFCPKCGSTNIGFGGPMGEFDVPREFCKDCEFGKFELGLIEFPLATEINKRLLKKSQKEISKNNKYLIFLLES